MKTLSQVLSAVAEANAHLGATIDSVTAERFDGETALHMCAKWGDAEGIRVLVENGADINKRGEDRNTPLHYAAMLGHLAAAQCLVALGAANERDMYGNFPIDLAQDHNDVRAFLESAGY